MPDKSLTIATYAAGASLAAVTLIYVFAPTFFIDGEAAGTSANARKKGVVGLVNPLNDCFINSVLQALAGLVDLRLYLIRETHRRTLDGSTVYTYIVEDPSRKHLSRPKIEGLQSGVVTYGLKDILDALNERPLYKKTISASPFVVCLEHAFQQRISRQQQDAQEFLQVVAERLNDEYHAGQRARKNARESLNTEKEEEKRVKTGQSRLEEESGGTGTGETSQQPNRTEKEPALEDEDGFPMEGGSESQIECQTCGFKPKPTKTTFCSLTLSVPQVSSTSLSSCFDQMFKTEFIDDFKCEKCRLVHALKTFQEELSRSNSEKFKERTRKAIGSLQQAIETDPEQEVKGIELPDSKFAPKRKIAKHVRITKFPKVMAIHLSRSIFDASRSTMKNSAKVSFPERLPLGGLLDQKIYKLVSVVCHKGSHHSGHYESFRRQSTPPPFSTPNTFQVSEVYSPSPSTISTPHLQSPQKGQSPIPDTGLATSSSINGRQSSESSGVSSSSSNTTPTNAKVRDPDNSSLRSVARSARESISSRLSRRSITDSPTSFATVNGNDIKETTRTSMSDVVRGKRKKAPSNRWWRISDEKIKEARTSEVLGMQREIYMLFYELEGAGE